MQETIHLFDLAQPFLQKGIAPALIGAGVQVVGGLLQGIIGSRKRKEDQKAAQRQQQNAQNAYNNFNFGGNNLQNPFGDVTNTFGGLQNQFAGLQVGLQGAQQQQQANDQSFANILDSQVQAGGGAAGNATALAREAARSNQQIAGGIQQQELANQQLQAQGAAQLDTQQAQGEARAQQLRGQGAQYITGLREEREYAKFQRNATNLGRADETLGAANTARTNATNAIFGGLSAGAGSYVSSLGSGNATGKSLQNSKDFFGQAASWNPNS